MEVYPIKQRKAIDTINTMAEKMTMMYKYTFQGGVREEGLYLPKSKILMRAKELAEKGVELYSSTAFRFFLYNKINKFISFP